MKVFLFLSSFVLFCGNVAAQSSLEYHPVLHFTPFRAPIFYTAPVIPVTNLAACGSQTQYLSPHPVVKGKPYEAFFCKLEVKTERYFGLGVRFHAGEYDSDMKQYIPNY